MYAFLPSSSFSKLLISGNSIGPHYYTELHNAIRVGRYATNLPNEVQWSISYHIFSSLIRLSSGWSIYPNANNGEQIIIFCIITSCTRDQIPRLEAATSHSWSVRGLKWLPLEYEALYQNFSKGTNCVH